MNLKYKYIKFTVNNNIISNPLAMTYFTELTRNDLIFLPKLINFLKYFFDKQIILLCVQYIKRVNGF